MQGYFTYFKYPFALVRLSAGGLSSHRQPKFFLGTERVLHPKTKRYLKSKDIDAAKMPFWERQTQAERGREPRAV